MNPRQVYLILQTPRARVSKISKDFQEKKLKITAKTQLEAPSPAFHGTDGTSKARTGAKDLVHAQCFPGILHAVLTA